MTRRAPKIKRLLRRARQTTRPNTAGRMDMSLTQMQMKVKGTKGGLWEKTTNKTQSHKSQKERKVPKIRTIATTLKRRS